MNRSMLAVFATLFFAIHAQSQEVLRIFNLNPVAPTSVTSEVIVKASDLHELSYTPLDASRPGTIKAWDVSHGTELAVRMSSTRAVIALPPISSKKAEVRVRIEETVPSTGLTLNRVLPKGRYVVNLPSGYVVESCSLPAQIQAPDGRINLGIVQRSDVPLPLELRIRRDAAQPPTEINGNFTARDNRIVSYQLLDPNEHKIRLWLEMYVDHPGQSHFYSQLRLPDHTSDPVTLDVDRGIELPTRILSGKQANAIGDSPTAFPDDALVLVADLGYAIPAYGSARLRSFQTATDPEGYRLVNQDTLRLDRFISRTRTQYILPPGWSLDSIDQPGVISSTPDGRVVLDFVASSAQAERLTILAHRNTGATPQSN